MGSELSRAGRFVGGDLSRRSEARSRLAEGHRRRRRAAALNATSAVRLLGRRNVSERSGSDARTGPWMTMREDRITLYPVGREARYPDLSCTGEGKAQQRRDPSERAGRLLPWTSTVTRLSWLVSWLTSATLLAAGYKPGQHGASGGKAGGQIAPQRDHQL